MLECIPRDCETEAVYVSGGLAELIGLLLVYSYVPHAPCAMKHIWHGQWPIYRTALG